MSRYRRLLATVSLTVSGALIATACVPGSQSEESVDLTAILVDAGALIVDKADPDGVDFSLSSVVVTADQVSAMTAQVEAGGGYTGYELDDLTALAESLPPFSFFLAGWARDHDGPGAQAVRGLMGDQDWTSPTRVLWPDAALALFVLDFTADVDPHDLRIYGASALAAEFASFTQRQALDVGALCTGAANFIHNALARLFSAIEAAAAAAERELGIVGRILGMGIRLFHQVVTAAVEVVNEVTAAMLAPVRTAITVIAVLQQVSSALRPWAVAMTADPTSIVMRASAQTGAVGATITAQGLPEYPQWVRQCGAALGLTLPDPLGVGSKIEWDLEVWPNIDVEFGEGDGVVQPDSTAKMTYHVPPEDPKAVDGIPVGGVIEVRLTPDRDQLHALVQLADGLLSSALANVPAVLRDYVASVVASLRAEALVKLKDLLTPNATSVIAIPLTFHLPKKEDDPQEPLPERPRPGQNDPDDAFCRSYATYIAPRLAQFDSDAARFVELAEQWSVDGPATRDHLISIAPAVPAGFLARARDLDGQSSAAAQDALLKEIAGAVDWAINNCQPPYREVFQLYRPWLD